MAAHLKRWTGLAIVDTAIIPGIETLGVPSLLIMREMPADREARFLPGEGSPPWDVAIVPDPDEHWVPVAAARLARRTEVAGWIYRATTVVPRVEPGMSQVLVAMGGGGRPEPAAEIRTIGDGFIAGARARSACRSRRAAVARDGRRRLIPGYGLRRR